MSLPGLLQGTRVRYNAYIASYLDEEIMRKAARPMITGIGHVAFRVTSLQRALDFYCTKLGFSEAFALSRRGSLRPGLCMSRLPQALLLSYFLIRRMPQEQSLHGILLRATNMSACWLMICQLPSMSWQHGALRFLDPLSRGWIPICNTGSTIPTAILSN